jgi:hypothetical protein
LSLRPAARIWAALAFTSNPAEGAFCVACKAFAAWIRAEGDAVGSEAISANIARGSTVSGSTGAGSTLGKASIDALLLMTEGIAARRVPALDRHRPEQNFADLRFAKNVWPQCKQFFFIKKTSAL